MTIHRQALRFVIVGVASNAIAYLLYLGLCELGLTPRLAMTITYVLGVIVTFVGNRRWTFGHTGHISTAAKRHLALYGLGYAANWLVLTIGVYRLGIAHQLVQGCMIVFLASVFFMAQKYWIFAPSKAPLTER